MKSMRVFLPAVAFTAAMVSAFASDAVFANNAEGKQTTTPFTCKAGTLVTPPTGTCAISGGAHRCQVTIPVGAGFQVVDAFVLSTGTPTCSAGQELFYP